jgi:PAS domain S-box-containing protein
MDDVARELYGHLFDWMPELAWTALPDGSVDRQNRRFQEYTGIEHERLNGWGWTQVLHPDHLRRVVETWTAAVAAGQRWETQCLMRRHDGAYRWFLSRAAPIHDDGGRLVRWIGIHVDVDDRERAQQEFLSQLAHELLGPLFPIVTAVRLAMTRGDAVSRALAVIERQSARLLRVVEGLPQRARGL